MTTDPYRPVIRSQADLEQAWRTLMEPLGFGGHSLWMMLIGPDDHPLPALNQVEDCPTVPTEVETHSFGQLMRTVLDDVEPHGRWAFLRSRPGRGGPTDEDRAWARSLYDGCRSAGVPLEVVHLATDDTLVPIPMDDVDYVRAS